MPNRKPKSYFRLFHPQNIRLAAVHMAFSKDQQQSSFSEERLISATQQCSLLSLSKVVENILERWLTNFHNYDIIL